MAEYRDYGQTYLPEINGSNIGLTDVAASSQKYGQVYLATHDGTQRRDFMWKSFISFTYGGKYIEDFNLIAYTNGDRLSRSGYAPFEDNTSTYDNLDGLKYWKTHYRANTLELDLATDGIDQQLLDDFLHWFSAGVTRELILSEHPNRAILARVSEPPQLNLLPFDLAIDMKVAGYTYLTHTTLYKGEITLKFVMDEPHWYAVDNILGIKDGNRYIDWWEKPNGERVDIFASLDALKILYEDGIPLGSMFQKNMLLGNGAFASVEGDVISSVWSVANDEDIVWLDDLGEETGEWGNGTPNGEGARIEADTATAPYLLGTIAGAIIDASGNGIYSLPANIKAYFYYSGTAPAPTIILFTMVPEINNEGYISSPCNTRTNPLYNTITIESVTKQELYFTTPNIYTSYNKAVEIFKTYVNHNLTWETVRAKIRDEVRHAKVREWAVFVVDNKASSASAVANANESEMISNLNLMFKNASGNFYPVTFRFNSETGEATGIFTYREVDGQVSNWSSYGKIITNVEESVGDMLRSNYIILRDRNKPTEDGYITEWSVDHKDRCHIISHDISGEVTNLSILYKNMYL